MKVAIFAIAWLLISIAAEDLSNGFGDKVNWIDFDKAKRLNQDTDDNRPILVLIYKPNCGACKNLKSILSQSMKFAEISEKFLMVNLEDNEEFSNNPDYTPDGQYVPRVFLIDKQGRVRHDLVNESSIGKKYKHYFPDAKSLIETMKKALEIVDKSEEIELKSNEL